MNQVFIAGDESANTNLREGRGAALSVVLKESPETVWDEQYRNKLIQTLLSQLASNTVPITLIAIRSCGYLLQYLMNNDIQLPTNLLTPFVRVKYEFINLKS